MMTNKPSEPTINLTTETPPTTRLPADLRTFRQKAYVTAREAGARGQGIVIRLASAADQDAFVSGFRRLARRDGERQVNVLRGSNYSLTLWVQEPHTIR